MEFMRTKEVSEKWGYTQDTVAGWCKDDKIYFAVKPDKKGVNECQNWI